MPDGTSHAFVTGANGVGLTDLGTFGGQSGGIFGINAAGQLAGVSTYPGWVSVAFITSQNGAGMTPLGTNVNSAAGINASGQIAGQVGGVMGPWQAYLSGPNGQGQTGLGILSGGQGMSLSYAFGLNDNGQVVGGSNTGGVTHAFITGANGVGMRDLGTLGGNNSNGMAINASGQVVGWAEYDAQGDRHAFITGPDGAGMTDLASFSTLPGNWSTATGINSAGQVVGQAYTADGLSAAFVTGANGVGMLNLNSVVDLPGGVVLSSAVAINDAGQIIATGQGHAYLLSAVPEANTSLMMCLGLFGVAWAWRQKYTSHGVIRTF
jgi:probable HAF family extracellular repeat protein